MLDDGGRSLPPPGLDWQLPMYNKDRFRRNDHDDIYLKGHVTEDGELIFEPPKDLPPGEVEITIEVPRESMTKQDFTDEEIKELLTFTPKSGKEIVEQGLVGG